MKSAGIKQHIMVVSKFKKGVRTTKEEKYILVYYYKGTTFDSKSLRQKFLETWRISCKSFDMPLSCSCIFPKTCALAAVEDGVLS